MVACNFGHPHLEIFQALGNIGALRKKPVDTFEGRLTSNDLNIHDLKFKSWLWLGWRLGSAVSAGTGDLPNSCMYDRQCLREVIGRNRASYVVVRSDSLFNFRDNLIGFVGRFCLKIISLIGLRRLENDKL